MNDSVGLDTVHLLEATAGKWIDDKANVNSTPSYWHSRARIPRHFVILGTSGSHDYLKDSTANRCFWSIRNYSSSRAEGTAGTAIGTLNELLAGTADCTASRLIPRRAPSPRALVDEADDANTVQDPPCDGIHDTGAPLLYLCTRCFPHVQDVQRDLDEREDDEVHQNGGEEHQETI